MPLVLMLAVWWLWLPGGLWVIKGLNHWWFSGQDFTQWYDLWLFNVAFNGAFPWLFLAIGGIGTLVIGILNSDDKSPAPVVATVVIGLVVAIVGGIFWGMNLWDNDKDYGRYYAYSTTFYVNDTQKVPDSLNRLVEGAGTTTDCSRFGAHDVFSCVKQGQLSSEGWDPRVSSFTGAQIAMQRKVGDVQRASLAAETVTYINAANGRPAMWTGILDGSGKEQSMAGVVEWQGKGDARLCKFEGDFAIKRAFHGERGNSLPNYLAEKFPKFRWKLSDAWGYCDGNQPVVVLPVTKPILWQQRTVDTAAGIIVIRGDHGQEPKMEHLDSVEPGSYPGPVYPLSLVAHQREQTEWAAGRKNHDRYSFGYEPTGSGVQQGNVSEYLLRDKATGRLVYVTPLTLRNSSSEVFVAYSVTFADEVHGGRLNELSMYVLDENDPKRINIDTLASTANDWMARNAGLFRANEGVLIEFTPVNGEVWRAFGEMNNQVVYQLDISLNSRIKPNLVSLSTEYGLEPAPSQGVIPGAPQPAANGDCNNPASLSVDQLQQCANTLVGELAKRAATTPPK